jgi:hypothetical protein
MLVKRWPLADLMVAVTDGSVSAFEKGGESGFAVSKRHQIAPVAVHLVTPLHRGLSPLHPRPPGRIMPAGG